MNIDFVKLEGGSFRMGSDLSEIESLQREFAYAFAGFSPSKVRDWLIKQTPPFEAEVRSFEMSRGLTTRAQFAAFERATGIAPSGLTDGDTELPVEGISFAQASGFCDWLSRLRGERISLPTETEWEFAASSRGRFRYPWGDEWDPSRANTAESGPGRASKSGEFSLGRSAQGIEDLAGNLEEWTSSTYRPYAGAPVVRDRVFNEQGPDYHILRGGWYGLHGDLCHASRRHGFSTGWALAGLRIVRRPV